MVEFTGRPPRLPPELVAAKKSVRTWGSIVPLGAVSLIVVGAAITVIVRFCAAVTILNFSDLRISYSEHNWSLQTPAGTVANANSVATEGLGTGELVQGWHQAALASMTPNRLEPTFESTKIHSIRREVSGWFGSPEKNRLLYLSPQDSTGGSR
jgi:hypothetical protein